MVVTYSRARHGLLTVLTRESYGRPGRTNVRGVKDSLAFRAADLEALARGRKILLALLAHADMLSGIHLDLYRLNW